MIKVAPGSVSVTADSWTVDTTKAGFLGVTAHWIEVKAGKWTLQMEVIGFQSISGDHSRQNLGRYIVGVFDQVGIMGKNHSKVHYTGPTLSMGLCFSEHLIVAHSHTRQCIK